jgi:hypothetical protein
MSNILEGVLQDLDELDKMDYSAQSKYSKQNQYSDQNKYSAKMGFGGEAGFGDDGADSGASPDDDGQGSDDNPEAEPEEQPAAQDDKQALWDALNNALAPIGLVSLNVEKQDDGSWNADMSFEDGTELSLEFDAGEGGPVFTVLTTDNEIENPLPPEFSDEEGNFILDVAALPLDDIKTVISGIVSVDNASEAFRRVLRNGIVEKISIIVPKRRISLKNEKKKKVTGKK